MDKATTSRPRGVLIYPIRCPFMPSRSRFRGAESIFATIVLFCWKNLHPTTMPLSYTISYSYHWLDAPTEKDEAFSRGNSEKRNGNIEHGSYTLVYFPSNPYSASERSIALDQHLWESREMHLRSNPDSVALSLIKALTALTTTAQERSLLEDLLKQQLQPLEMRANANNQLGCGTHDRLVVLGSTQSFPETSDDNDTHPRSLEDSVFIAFGHWGQFVEASLNSNSVESTRR
jgi:hypothetical protein